ncbi:GAF domain-containing protein [Streptomyces sp. NPDC003011]
MGARRSTAAQTVRHVARSSPFSEVPRALCQTVCESMAVDGVTFSLLTDTPSRQLLCASDATALRLEEVQFTVAEGPCITAAADGIPVLMEDLDEDSTRWPFFSAAMSEQLPEVKAVYAFPLHLGEETLGSMDLFRCDKGGLDARAVQESQHVADAVVESLLSTLTELLTGNAPPAWEPADVIRSHWSSTHQAIGVVAARLDISISDALARMRAEAFRTGETLAEVTATVLNHRPRA